MQRQRYAKNRISRFYSVTPCRVKRNSMPFYRNRHAVLAEFACWLYSLADKPLDALSSKTFFHSRILIWRTSSLVFMAASKCVKWKKCNLLTNFFRLLQFSHSTGFYSRYRWFSVYWAPVIRRPFWHNISRFLWLCLTDISGSIVTDASGSNRAPYSPFSPNNRPNI